METLLRRAVGTPGISESQISLRGSVLHHVLPEY